MHDEQGRTGPKVSGSYETESCRVARMGPGRMGRLTLPLAAWQRLSPLAPCFMTRWKPFFSRYRALRLPSGAQDTAKRAVLSASWPVFAPKRYTNLPTGYAMALPHRLQLMAKNPSLLCGAKFSRRARWLRRSSKRRRSSLRRSLPVLSYAILRSLTIRRHGFRSSRWARSSSAWRAR